MTFGDGRGFFKAISTVDQAGGDELVKTLIDGGISQRHIVRKLIAALDPLARCALVRRGIQHASLADCALLLEVSRGIVAGAYSRALRWNGEPIGAHAAPNEDQMGSRV
jgi:hypothetical protein